MSQSLAVTPCFVKSGANQAEHAMGSGHCLPWGLRGPGKGPFLWNTLRRVARPSQNSNSRDRSPATPSFHSGCPAGPLPLRALELVIPFLAQGSGLRCRSGSYHFIHSWPLGLCIHASYALSASLCVRCASQKPLTPCSSALSRRHAASTSADWMP